MSSPCSRNIVLSFTKEYAELEERVIEIYSCADFVLLLVAVLVYQGDPMLDSENLCGKMTECVDCHASCEENTEYRFRNWLFNLEDDPRETTDLLNVYPEVRIVADIFSTVVQSYGNSVMKDMHCRNANSICVCMEVGCYI